MLDVFFFVLGSIYSLKENITDEILTKVNRGGHIGFDMAHVGVASVF